MTPKATKPTRRNETAGGPAKREPLHDLEVKRWGNDDERLALYAALFAWTDDIGDAIFRDPRVALYLDRAPSEEERQRREKTLRGILDFVQQMKILREAE